MLCVIGEYHQQAQQRAQATYNNLSVALSLFLILLVGTTINNTKHLPFAHAPVFRNLFLPPFYVLIRSDI